MPRGAIAIILFVALLGPSAPAAALVIQGQFLPLNTGPDGSMAHGGGTIQDVFAAAANLWELAILDDATVAIDYYWDPGSDPLGYTDGISIGIPRGNPWFVDATPDTSEEYSSATQANAALDGTTLNYGVGFTGGIGAAVGFDLFTVLVHEIGHILSFGPNAFSDWADGDADITSPRPLAGLSLPVAGGCCHLDTPLGYSGIDPVLFPFLAAGERRLISDADLLFVAQGGEWQELDPSRFAPVPEPGTLTLFGLGAIGLARRRHRRSARSTLQAKHPGRAK